MVNEKTVKPGRVVLKIFILISLILIIFFAVLVSMNENNIELNWYALNINNLIEKFKTETAQQSTGAFSLGDLDISQTAEYQGNLVVLSDYDIRLLSPNGEEVWYYTHDVRHPVLNINGKWILVYENNGKSYMVIKDGKVVLESKLDEEIAFGEVTDKYLLFITISSNGYKRTVNFIAPETGISLGALYIDDYYPYYVKNVNNNSGFLLYGLGMNSINISTIIRIYESTGKTAPVASVEAEGLYPVMNCSNSNFIFAGENKVLYYDSNLNLTWSDEYTDRITAVGMFEDDNAVVALSGDTTKIVFYNSAGREIKSIETENSIQSIEIYENTAAVIYGSKVLFYDSSGRLIDNASLPGINLNVHFLNNERVFLVSEHEAILYNISRK